MSTSGREADRRVAEQRLHEAMLDIYDEVGKLTGYWANYFLRDLKKHGGLVLARKLLSASTTSEGFERLKNERILHLSLEAVALRPEFRSLFTADELDRAKSRLIENGYTPDELPDDEAPPTPELEALLARVESSADQLARWDLRDDVVARGPTAREAMRRWLAEERLPPFAISVLERLAAGGDGSAGRAIDTYATLGGREQMLARDALRRLRAK